MRSKYNVAWIKRTAREFTWGVCRSPYSRAGYWPIIDHVDHPVWGRFVRSAIRLRPLIIAVTGITILACAPKQSAAAVVFPSISISTPTSGAYLEGATASTGSTKAGTYPLKRVLVGIDGANFVVASGTSQWSTSFNTASYPDGSHSVDVRAVDAFGNTATKSVTVSFANAPGSSPLPSGGTSAPVQTTSSPAPAPAAPAAATASMPAFACGVQYHGLWDNYGDNERTAVLDKMQQAGVKWIRMDIGWQAMESGPDQWVWWRLSLMDNLVNAARSRGMSVLGDIIETPSWANGGAAPNVPPSDPSTLQLFMKRMATRYAGKVAAWEIWNEENTTATWNGSVGQYVTLLQNGYRGVKSGDANALVVLGGINGNDTNWLNGIYSSGGKGYFNVVATHAYMGPRNLAPETDTKTPYCIVSVTNIENVMVQNGDGALPVWFTEFGWTAHSNTPSTPAWQRGVTQQQQADYLVRALKLIRANFPYVTNTFWYNERDTTNGTVADNSYGLLLKDLTPKPAYWSAQSYLAANP